MNAMNELQAGIDAGIEALAAMGAAESAAEDAGPKAKGRKTKAKPQTAAETKAKAAEPKPEAATLDGFALKDGADPETLKAFTTSAIDAVAAISRKDSSLLDSYLTLGAFNSAAAKAFKSTKIMGQYIAEKVPASATLDVALRSNCKWLWEALNDPEHEAYGRLLPALGGINDISSYKSGNPTVIRRDYSATLKEDAARAEAERLGLTGDDAVKALADHTKATAEEAFKADLEDAVAHVMGQISETRLSKADIGFSVGALVALLAGRKGDDFLSALNTFKVSKAPKAYDSEISE